MKTSTQLKALIRNLSRDKGINAEILLRREPIRKLLANYGLEMYMNIKP